MKADNNFTCLRGGMYQMSIGNVSAEGNNNILHVKVLRGRGLK